MTMNGSAAAKFAGAVPASTSFTAPAADKLAIAMLRRLPSTDIARISVVGAGGDGVRSYVAASLVGAPIMLVNSKPSLEFLQWLSKTAVVNEVRYYGSPAAIPVRGYDSVVAAMAVAQQATTSPSPSPTGSSSESPSSSSSTTPSNSASGSASSSPTASPTTSPTPPTAIPAAFVVNGSGFGHGVGLSQYGAQAQALVGRTASQIVSFYFTGSSVTPVRDDYIVAVNLLHHVTRVSLQLHTVDNTPSVPVDDAGAVGDFVTSSRSKLTSKDARYRFDLGGTAAKPTLVITQIAANGKQSTFMTTGAVTLHWGGTRNPARAGDVPAYVDLAGPGEALHDGYGRYRYGDLRIAAVSYDDNGTTKASIEVANNVRLHDEYLRGIGEVPASWQPAALQAQVIASRGFALATARTKIKYGCACQLYDGTTSQVFAGWMREAGYSASQTITRAAELGIRLPAAIIGSSLTTPATTPSTTSGATATSSTRSTSASATKTATATKSATTSAGASPSTTHTTTATATKTPSTTPTSSPTASPTTTGSATVTISATPSASATASPSATPSWSPTAELPLAANFFGRKWDQAVLATSTSLTTGLAATVAGKPIVTYFYSASGGRTENSEDVWGGRLSYTRSIADPWSLAECVPTYIRAWKETISQQDMADFFGLTNVVKVAIGARTEGGAVVTLTARSSSGRTSTRYGTDMRKTFDLRSRWVRSIKPRT